MWPGANYSLVAILLFVCILEGQGVVCVSQSVASGN